MGRKIVVDLQLFVCSNKRVGRERGDWRESEKERRREREGVDRKRERRGGVEGWVGGSQKMGGGGG